MMQTSIILTLVLGPALASASTILMVPWEQYSHVHFHVLAGTALKERGHEVWVLADFKFKEKIELAGLIPLVFTPSSAADRTKKTKGQSAITMFFSMMEAVGNLCSEVMNNPDVISAMENHNFDLAIMDSFPLYRCFYTIPYKYDIPYITIGAWHDGWSAGVPVLPSIEASSLLPVDRQMSFSQRLLNTVIYVIGHIVQHTLAVGNDFISVHAPQKPRTSFRELFYNSEIFLITMETTCYEYGRLSLPNYKFIGSLSSARETRPLPGDIESFISDSPDGVIIVTFGSYSGFGELVLPTVEILIEAFKDLKQKVILKFDKSLLHFIPENFLVLEWVPQTDLLADPRVKLFITHGGLNGVMEGIHYAVPLMILPIQVEQKANGLRAEQRGYGKLLDPANLTVDQTRGIATELITNTTYKQNLEKCSEILSSLPSPLTSMVFWTEHVLRFGGSHLKQPNAELPFVQFFMLDILAFFVALDICIIFIVWICCFRPVCRRCCRSAATKKKTE